MNDSGNVSERDFRKSCDLLGIFPESWDYDQTGRRESPETWDIVWHVADWCLVTGRRFSLQDALANSLAGHLTKLVAVNDPFDHESDQLLCSVDEEIAREIFPAGDRMDHFATLSAMDSLAALGAARHPDSSWCERQRASRAELWAAVKRLGDHMLDGMSLTGEAPWEGRLVDDDEVSPSDWELASGTSHRYAVSRVALTPYGRAAAPMGLYPDRRAAEAAFRKGCESARASLGLFAGRLPEGAEALAALSSFGAKLEEQEWTCGQNISLVYPAITHRVPTGKWEIANVAAGLIFDHGFDEDWDRWQAGEWDSAWLEAARANLVLSEFSCSAIGEDGPRGPAEFNTYDEAVRDHFDGHGWDLDEDGCPRYETPDYESIDDSERRGEEGAR